MYEDLYAQNLGLLYRLARRYAWACARDRAVDVDDLIQAGFFGLVKAAATFDESAGKTWAAWAAWYVKRTIAEALGFRDGRCRRADADALPLDAPLSVDDPDGLSLGDTLPDDSLPDTDAALLLDDMRQSVRAAVEQLPDRRQRLAVQLCSLDGRTYREAAEALGVSSERVRQLIKAGQKRLRKDARLQVWADDLDARTRFHAHKGVAAFNRDWTSTTEAAALWRVEQQNQRLAALLDAWTGPDRQHAEEPET